MLEIFIVWELLFFLLFNINLFILNRLKYEYEKIVENNLILYKEL